MLALAAPEDNIMTRDAVLSKASECVSGGRQDDYGSPENNFARIAAMWTAYLNFKVHIEPHDVAAMMAAVKLSRIASGGHGKADNWIDLAGYAACGGELQSINDQVSNNVRAE